MPTQLRAPIFAISFVVLLTSAAAKAESNRVENFLVIAEDAFLDVEYEDALEALERAEALGEASPQQLARLLALRGTIYFLLENEAQARAEYLRLLNMAPRFELPETHPPRAAQFLESVRQEVSVQVSIEHEPPRSFAPGEPLQITALIRGVGDRHTVSIFFRPYGDSGYSSTEMTREVGDRFVGEIPAGGPIDADEGGIVEYFIMVAEGEERLANEGSPRNPLSFEVIGTSGRRPTTPRSTPVVRRWWFWTIIGLTVAAGLGLGLGFGLNIEEEVPTGTVDLTLRFPQE